MNKHNLLHLDLSQLKFPFKIPIRKTKNSTSNTLETKWYYIKYYLFVFILIKGS